MDERKVRTMMKFVDCSFPKAKSAFCTEAEALEYIKKNVKRVDAYKTINANGDVTKVEYFRGKNLVASMVYIPVERRRNGFEVSLNLHK